MSKKDYSEVKRLILLIEECLKELGRDYVTLIEIFAIIDSMPDSIYYDGEIIEWDSSFKTGYNEVKTDLLTWIKEVYYD